MFLVPRFYIALRCSVPPASRSLPCPHFGVFTGRVKTGSLVCQHSLSDLPPGLWRSPARLRVLSDIFPFVREHLSTYGKSTYLLPNDADFYYMVVKFIPVKVVEVLSSRMCNKGSV